MEARLTRPALVVVLVSLLSASTAWGASSRTQNFVVTAANPQHAAQIAQAAERFRRDLAMEWLGRELPAWRGPCPITVEVGPHLGAGGATSFMFENGSPFGWTMNIQGSFERVMDSVLPHEITHTIFATYFGRPLPRWADEGSCTTVEHESERRKQQDLLLQFLSSVPSRGIAFNKMFTMTEYPHDVIPLYSQGHSVSRYLIAHGGRRKFIQYLSDGMSNDSFDPRSNTIADPRQALASWTAATKSHYGFDSLSQLQLTWIDWVRKGRPPIHAPEAEMVASARAPRNAIVQAGENSADRVGAEEDGPADRRDLVAVRSQSSATAITSDAASPSGSWYGRNRAAASAEEPSARTAPSQSVATLAAESYRPGSIKNASPLSQTLTRPQPIGRPQQTILEWSNENPTPPAAQTRAAAQPSSYYSAGPAPKLR